MSLCQSAYSVLSFPKRKKKADEQLKPATCAAGSFATNYISGGVTLGFPLEEVRRFCCSFISPLRTNSGLPYWRSHPGVKIPPVMGLKRTGQPQRNPMEMGACTAAMLFV